MAYYNEEDDDKKKSSGKSSSSGSSSGKSSGGSSGKSSSSDFSDPIWSYQAPKRTDSVKANEALMSGSQAALRASHQYINKRLAAGDTLNLGYGPNYRRGDTRYNQAQTAYYNKRRNQQPQSQQPQNNPLQPGNATQANARSKATQFGLQGIGGINPGTPDLMSNDKWYAGDSPTDVEAAARIELMGLGQDAMNELMDARWNKESSFYHPYSGITSEAVGHLAALGVNIPAGGLPDSWFDKNLPLLAPYYKPSKNSTTGAPTLGKRASANEQLAYWAYQAAQQRDNTNKAETELAALKEELKYKAGSAKNYSDDEILSSIDWSDYPTLQKMTNDARDGVPVGLVRFVDWDQDYLPGMLWAARNDGGTGDSFSDSVSALIGFGGSYARDEKIAEKLNPESENYAPYSVGSTMDKVGQYWGVYEFDDKWFADNRQYANSQDPMQQKMYKQAWDAHQFTTACREERDKLYAAIDEQLGWGMDLSDKESLDELLSSSDYRNLAKLDKSMISGILEDTTGPIDYRRKDVEDYIAKKLAEKAAEKSTDDHVKDTRNNFQKAWDAVTGGNKQKEPDTAIPAPGDIVEWGKTDPATDELRRKTAQDAAPVIGDFGTQEEKDQFRYGDIGQDKGASDITNVAMGGMPAGTGTKIANDIIDKSINANEYLANAESINLYNASRDNEAAILKDINDLRNGGENPPPVWNREGGGGGGGAPAPAKDSGPAYTPTSVKDKKETETTNYIQGESALEKMSWVDKVDSEVEKFGHLRFNPGVVSASTTVSDVGPSMQPSAQPGIPSEQPAVPYAENLTNQELIDQLTRMNQDYASSKDYTYDITKDEYAMGLSGLITELYASKKWEDNETNAARRRMLLEAANNYLHPEDAQYDPTVSYYRSTAMSAAISENPALASEDYDAALAWASKNGTQKTKDAFRMADLQGQLYSERQTQGELKPSFDAASKYMQSLREQYAQQEAVEELSGKIDDGKMRVTTALDTAAQYSRYQPYDYRPAFLYDEMLDQGMDSKDVYDIAQERTKAFRAIEDDLKQTVARLDEAGISLPGDYRKNMEYAQAQANRYALEGEYFGMRYNKDFEALSKTTRDAAKQKLGMADWEIATAYADGTAAFNPALANPSLLAAAANPMLRASNERYAALSMLTDDEMNTLFYVAGKAGEQAAEAYYDTLTDEQGVVTTRIGAQTKDELLNIYNKMDSIVPFAGTAGAVLMHPVEVVGGVHVLRMRLQGKEANPFHATLAIGQAGSEEKQQTKDGIQTYWDQRGNHLAGQVGGFFYDAITSAAESGEDALISGLFGYSGLISGKFGDGSKFLSRLAIHIADGTIAASPMIFSAGGQAYADALLRGVDPNKAFTYGMISGFSEAVSEGLEIEGIADAADLAKKGAIWSKLLNSTGFSMLNEFAGESLNEVVGTVADNWMSGENSKEAIRRRELAADGMKPDAIEKQIQKEFWTDVMYAGFLGAASAGISSSAAGITGALQYRASYKDFIEANPHAKERLVAGFMEMNMDRPAAEQRAEIFLRSIHDSRMASGMSKEERRQTALTVDELESLGENELYPEIFAGAKALGFDSSVPRVVRNAYAAGVQPGPAPQRESNQTITGAARVEAGQDVPNAEGTTAAEQRNEQLQERQGLGRVTEESEVPNPEGTTAEDQRAEQRQDRRETRTSTQMANDLADEQKRNAEPFSPVRADTSDITEEEIESGPDDTIDVVDSDQPQQSETEQPRRATVGVMTTDELRAEQAETRRAQLDRLEGQMAVLTQASAPGTGERNQTTAIGGILGMASEVRDSLSNGKALAAAKHLMKKLGGDKALKAIRGILVEAAHADISDAKALEAIQTAALSDGESSKILNEIANKRATPTRIRRLLAAAAIDSNNQETTDTINRNVQEAQIAQREQELAGEGALEPAKAAEKKAKKSRKRMRRAVTGLEKANANVEAAQENLRDASENMLSDADGRTDDGKFNGTPAKTSAALNQLENAFDEQQRAEQEHAEAEAENREAEEEYESVALREKARVREQAAADVSANNQRDEQLRLRRAEEQAAAAAEAAANETAMVDAEALTDDALAKYNPDADAGSAGNNAFVSAFLETIPEEERSRYVNEDGTTTPEFQQRVEKALYQAAFGEQGILTRLAVSADEGVQNLRKALTNIVAPLTRMNRDTQNGNRYDYNLAGTIGEAVNRFLDLYESGQSVAGWLNQASVSDNVSQAVKSVMQMLENNLGDPQSIVRNLSNLFENASRTGSPKSANMDGEGAPMTTDQLVAESFAETEAARANAQEQTGEQDTVYEAETLDNLARQALDNYIAENGLELTPEEYDAELAKWQEQMRQNAEDDKAMQSEMNRRSDEQKKQRFRRYADKLAKKFGLKITFENGTDEQGRQKWYGYFDTNTGTITIDSTMTEEEIFHRTLFHELTHRTEDTEFYGQLANILLNHRFGTNYNLLKENRENGQTTQADRQLQADIDEKINQYRAIWQRQGKDPSTYEDLAMLEIVADSAYDMFNGNEELINDFVRENPSLAQRILDWIKSVIARMSGEETGNLTKARDLFAKALEASGERFAQEQGEQGTQYSRVGTSPNGRGIYESNFSEGTPRDVRRQRVAQLWQQVWSQQPIQLNIPDGQGGIREITAQFDPDYDPENLRMTDLGKALYNKNGSAGDRNVTLNLADDLYDIARESVYLTSENEQGKPGATHEGVRQWHYFFNDIYYRDSNKHDSPYRVWLDVKEKDNGGWVYQLYARKLKNNEVPSSLTQGKGPAYQQSETSSELTVPQNDQDVNSQQHSLPAINKPEWMQAQEDNSTHDASKQFSIPQLARAAGLKFESSEETGQLYEVKYTDSQGNERTTVAPYCMRDPNTGEIVTDITPEMISKSPLGRLINAGVRAGTVTQETADAQTKMFADLATLAARYGDGGDMVWEIANAMMFSSLKNNSDAQYSTTIDYGTICAKTQAIVDIMSQEMLRKGRGLTREEVLRVYNETANEGLDVPCPVCYVFSRWMGVPSLLNRMAGYQQQFSGMTEKQVQKYIRDMQKQYGGGDPKAAAKNINSLKSKLDKQIEDLTQKRRETTEENARLEIDRKLDELEPQYRDVDAYNWVTQVLCKETEKGSGKYVLDPSYKPVPNETLFDLNKTGVFATKFPKSWLYRNTRGAGMGKAIMPYGGSQIGDVIKARGKNAQMRWTESQNPFFTGDDKSADRSLANTRRRMKAQNLIGGQRFQSTSDYRPEWGLDYMMTFLEMQAVGAKAQLYTKVIEAVDMFAKAGAEVNLSLMGQGKGYHIDPNDPNGIPVEGVGNVVLDFSSVTGIDADQAREKIGMYDNVQGILVGLNDIHIRAAMASDWINFIIPWHSSGNSKNVLASLLASVGETLDTSDASDYTDEQNDRVLENRTQAQKDAWDVRMKLLTGKFWKKGKVVVDEHDMSVINSNPYLSDLFTRFYEDKSATDTYGVRLTASQAGHVFPYEYWDTNSTRETADVNGQRFAEYCESIGLEPRFSRFKDDTGYWKLLIDRSMYNNDGSYHTPATLDVTRVGIDDIATQVGHQKYGDQARYDRVLANLDAQDEKADNAEALVHPAFDEAFRESANEAMNDAMQGGEDPDLPGDESSNVQYSLPDSRTQQRDAEYQKAVESGDIETAQSMVDEAAKEAGYTIRAYHGSDKEFTVFKPGIRGEMWFASTEGSAYNNRKNMYDTYLRIQNPYEETHEIGTDSKFDPTGVVERARQSGHDGAIVHFGLNPEAVDRNMGMFSDSVMATDPFTNYMMFMPHGELLESLAKPGETLNQFMQRGKDSDLYSWYVTFKPNQIKSAEPVTYDDAGNVVPLSERFNKSNPDIRYSLPSQETMDSARRQRTRAALDEHVARQTRGEQRQQQEAQRQDARRVEDLLQMDPAKDRMDLHPGTLATHIFDKTRPLFRMTQAAMQQQREQIAALRAKQKAGEKLTAEEKAIIKRGVQGYDSSRDTRDLVLARDNAVHNSTDFCLTKHMVDEHGNRVYREDGTEIGSLSDIVGKVNQSDEKAFNAYWVARYAKERLQQNRAINNELTDVEALDRQIAEAEAAHPEWKGIVEEACDWYAQFMQTWLVNTGLVRQSTLDTFRQMYPHYIPIFSAEQTDSAATRRGRDRMGANHLKRAGEGQGKINNPVMNIAESVQRHIASAKQAEVMRAFADFFDTDEGRNLGIVEETAPTPAQEANGSGVGAMESMSNFQWVTQDPATRQDILHVPQADGSVRNYRCSDAGIIKALVGTQPTGKGLKAAAHLTGFVCALATAKNLTFSVQNFLSDGMTAMITGNTGGNLITYNIGRLASMFDLGRNMWREFRGRETSDAYQKYQLFGGMGSRYSMRETDVSREFRNKLYHNEVSSMRGLAHFLADVAQLKHIEALSNFLEQATRYNEFTRGHHDLESYEGLLAAAKASREVTTDFSKSGDWAAIRYAGQLVPFIRAQMQGTYKSVRMFSEENAGHRGRYMRRIVFNTLVSSAVMAALRGLDWDDEEKQAYEEMSPYEKVKYAHIKIGGKILRIKRTQDGILGFANAVGDMIGDLSNGYEDNDYAQFFDCIEEVAKNLLPSHDTVFEPFLDAANNQTWYNSRIEGPEFDGMAEQDKFNSDTLPVFRWASNLSNKVGVTYSPLDWQYIFQQYMGSAGRILLGEANGVYGTVTGQDAFTAWDAINVVGDELLGRTSYDPVFSSYASSTFYDGMSMLAGIEATNENIGQPGHYLRSNITPGEHAAALREIGTMTKKGGALYQIKGNLSRLWKQYNAIDDSMASDAEKEESKRNLRRQINMQALHGNTIISDFMNRYGRKNAKQQAAAMVLRMLHGE